MHASVIVVDGAASVGDADTQNRRVGCAGDCRGR